jgi:hypothetical protein
MNSNLKQGQTHPEKMKNTICKKCKTTRCSIPFQFVDEIKKMESFEWIVNLEITIESL